MTEEILKNTKNLFAVEKDPIFANYIKESFDINIFEEDFLKFDLKKLPKKNIKLIANLPYNLTSPIITKIIKNSHLFSSLTIMVQYEVAKRITAKKNCKDYSSFTILIEKACELLSSFKISASCFFPKPRVDSAVLHLKVRKGEPFEEDFHLFVQRSFQTRRKKLSKSLERFYKKEDIERGFKLLNIDPFTRAENLSKEEFYSLFSLLKKRSLI